MEHPLEILTWLLENSPPSLSLSRGVDQGRAAWPRRRNWCASAQRGALLSAATHPTGTTIYTLKFCSENKYSKVRNSSTGGNKRTGGKFSLKE